MEREQVREGAGGGGGMEMHTRDHDHLDACFLAREHGLGHAGAGGVDEGDEAAQGQT